MRESIAEIRELPIQPEQSDRIGFEEACIEAGCSKSQMYKLTMNRGIPFQRYGPRKLVFSRKEIREWRDAKTMRQIPTTQMAENHLSIVAKKRAI